MVRKATTRLSSKGQVVLPAWVREELGLEAGDELVVSIEPGSSDRVVLARRRDPAAIERMLEPVHAWFRETGRDLVEELHEARREARIRERTRRRP